jgi:23S rRNA (guanosine2251-2'-O)-methyltransferase
MGDRDLIAGRNPVIEALKAGRPMNKILMQKGEREGSARMIEAMARTQGIVVLQSDKSTLDSMLGGGFHQGVIAFVAAKAYASLEDIIKAAAESGEPMLAIIADGVEDPHNLGAIIRTAEAVGAHGVVIPKRRAVGLTSVVSKASAGAIEHVTIARVPNTTDAIKELKKHGAWAIGADQGAELDYTACDMRGGVALVVGGEGDGMGMAARSQCDYLARLPMRGRLASLNASVAASVLMYEALRQRSL